MSIPFLKAKSLLLKAAAVLQEDELNVELILEDFLKAPSEEQLRSVYATLQECKAGEADKICKDISYWLSIIAKKELPIKSSPFALKGTSPSLAISSFKSSKNIKVQIDKLSSEFKKLEAYENYQFAKEKHNFLIEYIKSEHYQENRASFIQLQETLYKTKGITPEQEAFKTELQGKYPDFDYFLTDTQIYAELERRLNQMTNYEKALFFPNQYRFYISTSIPSPPPFTQDDILNILKFSKLDSKKQDEIQHFLNERANQTKLETVIKESGDLFEVSIAYPGQHSDRYPLLFEYIYSLHPEHITRTKDVLGSEWSSWESFCLPRQFQDMGKRLIEKKLTETLQGNLAKQGFYFLYPKNILDSLSSIGEDPLFMEWNKFKVNVLLDKSTIKDLSWIVQNDNKLATWKSGKSWKALLETKQFPLTEEQIQQTTRLLEETQASEQVAANSFVQTDSPMPSLILNKLIEDRKNFIKSEPFLYVDNKLRSGKITSLKQYTYVIDCLRMESSIQALQEKYDTLKKDYYILKFSTQEDPISTSTYLKTVLETEEQILKSRAFLKKTSAIFGPTNPENPLQEKLTSFFAWYPHLKPLCDKIQSDFFITLTNLPGGNEWPELNFILNEVFKVAKTKSIQYQNTILRELSAIKSKLHPSLKSEIFVEESKAEMEQLNTNFETSSANSFKTFFVSEVQFAKFEFENKVPKDLDARIAYITFLDKVKGLLQFVTEHKINENAIRTVTVDTLDTIVAILEDMRQRRKLKDLPPNDKTFFKQLLQTAASTKAASGAGASRALRSVENADKRREVVEQEARASMAAAALLPGAKPIGQAVLRPAKGPLPDAEQAATAAAKPLGLGALRHVERPAAGEAPAAAARPAGLAGLRHVERPAAGEAPAAANPFAQVHLKHVDHSNPAGDLPAAPRLLPKPKGPKPAGTRRMNRRYTGPLTLRYGTLRKQDE